MNETAISTTALDSIDAEIRDNLIAFFKDKGLPVKLITMTVGKANPPDAIKHQRIDTAAQEQASKRKSRPSWRKISAKWPSKAVRTPTTRTGNPCTCPPNSSSSWKPSRMQAKVCGLEGKATCTSIQNGSATPVYNLGNKH